MEINMKKLLVLLLVLATAALTFTACVVTPPATDVKTEVTLDAQGGTLESTTLTATKGASYSLPIPSKAGYTFEGWYFGETKIESTGTWAIDGAAIALVAQWSAKTTTVTLEGIDTPVTATYGAAYTLPTPEKSGYTFDGWSNGETKVESTGTWATDVATLALTAKWTAKTTVITLEGIDAPVTATFDAAYTLPTPEKSGYTFDGWYNGDTKVESVGTWAIEDAAITLTAKWTAKTTVITLEGVDTPVNATYGESYELPTPKKTGYSFAGWYNGDEKLASAGTWTIEDAALTLTAKWTAKTTVIVLNNDGETTTVSVTYGESYELPTPEKAGYSFLGWYLGDDKLETVGTWSLENAAVTLIARYEGAKSNVTLNADGGSFEGDALITINYGAAYALPIPTRENYHFIGWRDAEGGYVAAKGDAWVALGDVTVTATWQAVEAGATGNFNSFENGIEGVTNAAVNPGVITDGVVVVTSPAYNKDLFFCVGEYDVPVENNMKGSIYVFEADFTYVGGAATGQGLAFAGFTSITKTGNGNNGMHKCSYLKSSTDAASDGKAASVELYGVTYERGVTYRVRYEYIVGENVIKVYTNGEYVGTHTPQYTQESIDPTTVYAFQYYVRSQGAGTVLSFDNVFCGIIPPTIGEEEYTVTLDADGGEIEKDTLSFKLGEAYSIPAPTKAGYDFVCWVDADGNYFAANGVHWEHEGDVSLKATWAAARENGNFNNFENGIDGVTNAAVNPGVITEGAVVVTSPAYNKDLFFCVDEFEKVVTDNMTGTKYVFEADFTYLGGAATGQGLAFVGFTSNIKTGNGNGGMYKCSYLRSSTDAASDGKAVSVELYGATYERGVTYRVRYEFTVGEETMLVYTNGELVGTHILAYTQDLDPTAVYAFQYYVRSQGAGTILSFDNVYCGIEAPSLGDKEYKITLNADGGECSETETSVKYGEAYALPVPVKEGYNFLGWFDVEGNYFATSAAHFKLESDVSLKAIWAEARENGNFNNFENGIEGVTNAAVNPGVITGGAVVVTSPAYNKDLYFCVGEYEKVVTGNTAGMKYVFEADFTYLGGAAKGQGLAFVGFTSDIKTGNGNNGMHKCSYLRSSDTVADDGYATTVELYDAVYERGVTYRVRYEYIVGENVIKVYTNGEYVGTHTPKYTQESIDPTTVYAFQYYVRSQGAGTVLSFDNVYCGIEK